MSRVPLPASVVVYNGVTSAKSRVCFYVLRSAVQVFVDLVRLRVYGSPPTRFAELYSILYHFSIATNTLTMVCAACWTWQRVLWLGLMHVCFVGLAGRLHAEWHHGPLLPDRPRLSLDVQRVAAPGTSSTMVRPAARVLQRRPVDVV